MPNYENSYAFKNVKVTIESEEEGTPDIEINANEAIFKVVEDTSYFFAVDPQLDRAYCNQRRFLLELLGESKVTFREEKVKPDTELQRFFQKIKVLE